MLKLNHYLLNVVLIRWLNLGSLVGILFVIKPTFESLFIADQGLSRMGAILQYYSIFTTCVTLNLMLTNGHIMILAINSTFYTRCSVVLILHVAYHVRAWTFWLLTNLALYSSPTHNIWIDWRATISINVELQVMLRYK